MARIEVETAHGPIWFWGEDHGQPLVLLLTGLHASENTWRLRKAFRGVDYLRVHLPGNHCPAVDEVSIEAYARALDAALAIRFPGRAVMPVGLSAGALVALTMRSPGIRRLLLIEPPLRSHDLWPLQRALEPTQGYTAHELEQLWRLFGVGRDQICPRDYAGLLAGLATPAHVILGDEPLLPKRDLGRFPSLVDDESRRLLAAHPLVTQTTVCNGGHAVQREAFVGCVQIMVRQAQMAFDDPSIALV